MDELMELRRLRADLPDPTDTVLAEARARIVEHDVRPAVLLRPAPRPRRPLRRRVLVGIAASVAVATGAYALTAGGASRPSPHYKNAAQFLDAASAAALKAGDQSVPAGQYRHVRERLHQPMTGTPFEPNWYHVWASVPRFNMRQDWYLPGDPHDAVYLRSRGDYVSGSTQLQSYRITTTRYKVSVEVPSYRGIAESIDYSKCHGCVAADLSAWNIPTPTSIPTLPTDVEQLRASLYRWVRAMLASGQLDDQTFSGLALSGIGGVLATFPESAELRSALFQVAKGIPGITLHDSMKNADGVPGVGVGVTDRNHLEANLVFSADGRTFLGTNDIVRKRSAKNDVAPGTVLDWTTVTTLGNTGKPKFEMTQKTRR